MRVSDKKMNPILKKQIVDSFFKALLDMKNEKEIKLFLEDLLTDAEVETYSKRLAIIYWLKKGRSYSNVKDNLKVSSATIASIQNLIDKPGIKLALKKLEAEEWANQWSEKLKKAIKI